MTIAADLIALGVAFYDAQRGHGAADRSARCEAVCYMRRKELEPASGDAMPYYEALADALALRAAARIADKGCMGGKCNRTACPNRPAECYSSVERAYYCVACARQINAYLPAGVAPIRMAP